MRRRHVCAYDTPGAGPCEVCLSRDPLWMIVLSKFARLFSPKL